MSVSANTAYATFGTVVSVGAQGDITREFTQVLNILPGESQSEFPTTWGAARSAPGPNSGSGQGKGALWLRGGTNVEVYHHMPVPSAATSESEFQLSVSRAVTNPGTHFFNTNGTNPTPEAQSDESRLCNLSIGVPGEEDAFSRKLQPNVEGSDGLDFPVQATRGSNQERFVDIKITWSCPDSGDSVADIILYDLALAFAGDASATSAESTASATGTATSSSASATSTLVAPSEVAGFDLFGCVSSNSGFPTFELQSNSAQNSVQSCAAQCAGRNAFGVVYESCYCGDAVDPTQFTTVDEDKCSLPCPGNPSEPCGGQLRALVPRQINSAILLTVYVAIDLPGQSSTVTTATISGTSTSAATSTASPTAIPGPDDDCTVCLTGWCGWEITVLKPAACSVCNDGGLYYEFVEVDKTWRPVRCTGDICAAKKNLCQPAKCAGGFCGQYEIVEEDHCECEGGFEFKQYEFSKVVTGGGSSTNTDEHCEECEAGKVKGGSTTVTTGCSGDDCGDDEEDSGCTGAGCGSSTTVTPGCTGAGCGSSTSVTPGCTGADCGSSTTITPGCSGADCGSDDNSTDIVTGCTGHGCDDNGGFVIAGGAANIVSLVALAAGMLPFGLLQLL